MDGPSIFGAMLDRDAGWFRFGPDDVTVPSDRRYLPGTLVLETSWDCGQGWLVIRDCLVMGIWEVRGEPKHFTSSKMMCWVAADRGARLAILRGDKDLARTWRKAADEIHADICANALDGRGVSVQHYDTTALDASLLLMPLLRFLPPDDPRIRATVLAIGDELTRDGLVLRYQVEETDDGLSGEEGTFTICSFWLVSALTEIGEHQRARDICEKVLSYASSLLLYGEEIDPKSGRHLGNFPQAFTHLALINAVMHVIRTEQAAQRLAMGREVPENPA
jgi:GH15 family glucan-1,4-alpha-glucosidase